MKPFTFSLCFDDNDRVFGVRKFYGIVEDICYDLLELYLVYLDKSHFTIDPIYKPDIFMHARVYIIFCLKQIGNFHFLTKKCYMMGIKVLNGEYFREKLSCFDELCTESLKLVPDFFSRNSFFLQIVDDTVGLKYGCGNGGFYLMRDNTDKFLLSIYEVIVLHSFLVYFLIEVHGEILYLFVGFYIFEMKLQEGHNSSKDFYLLDGIKIPKRFCSDDENSRIFFSSITKKRENEKGFFGYLMKEMFFVEFRLPFFYEYHVIDEDLIGEIAFKIFLEFRFFFILWENPYFTIWGFKYFSYLGSKIGIQIPKVIYIGNTLLEFLNLVFELCNEVISEKDLIEMLIGKIKYHNSDNRVYNGILVLKHPVIINRSGFEIKIEGFNEIERYNREDNGEIGDKYLPYTIPERREIVSFEDIEDIDYKSKIKKYYLLFQYPNTKCW